MSMANIRRWKTNVKLNPTVLFIYWRPPIISYTWEAETDEDSLLSNVKTTQADSADICVISGFVFLWSARYAQLKFVGCT